MQEYVVREPLHQNGKFHEDCVGNSDPKSGSIGLCSKNVFNEKLLLFIHRKQWKINYKHVYDIHEIILLNYDI